MVMVCTTRRVCEAAVSLSVTIAFSYSLALTQGEDLSEELNLENYLSTRSILHKTGIGSVSQ